jgi:uncharacterized protein YbjQ (UPF0145 family)
METFMETLKGGGDTDVIINSNNIKLSSLMTYDVTKYEPMGIVRGTKVHGISLFRSIVGNLSSLFGGKNDAINKKVDDVYNESIQELINNALIMYPGVKMISGIEVTLSEMRNIIICVATGTALAPLKNVENMMRIKTQTRRRRTMPRVM